MVPSSSRLQLIYLGERLSGGLRNKRLDWNKFDPHPTAVIPVLTALKRRTLKPAWCIPRYSRFSFLPPRGYQHEAIILCLTLLSALTRALSTIAKLQSAVHPRRRLRVATCSHGRRHLPRQKMGGGRCRYNEKIRSVIHHEPVQARRDFGDRHVTHSDGCRFDHHRSSAVCLAPGDFFIPG